ncbi:hypothetical protein CF8_0176 [Aeromonas phage CF8]|nr:hypothetical protein CF8_0176 [Aeromonas phage CF8]
MTVKGIKENQIIVGTVKSGKVGVLPSKVIISSSKGSVEDLGVQLDWITPPEIIETESVKTPAQMVKAIQKHARSLEKEAGTRLQCLLDSLTTSSRQHFYDDGTDDNCISIWISKNTQLDLGKFCV